LLSAMGADAFAERAARAAGHRRAGAQTHHRDSRPAHRPVLGQAASSRTEGRVCPVWRSWMPSVICEIP
jgi:hypothetical protein